MTKGYGQKRYLHSRIDKIVQDDPSVTGVVLNGFGLNDAKLAVLAMALVNNTHVLSLHLDGNAITDRGACLLSYTLQQNKTLRLLSLNDNRIQSTGAEALATALHENDSLRTLRLANNSIGNHGAKRLRKMLKRNKAIEELVLEGNDIGSKICCKFDDRCKVQTDAGNACDATAASTAGADLPAYDSKEEMNSDSDGELMVALNSSALTLFGSSMYMTNDEAMKFIIGSDDHDLRDFDASSSWNDLASYMMNVQKTMGQSDQDSLPSDDSIDDVLSVVSEPAQEPSNEGKPKKKWTLFKKKIHVHL